MKLYYSDDYVAAAHGFDTTRKAGWIACSLAARPIAGVELVAPRPAARDELLRIHAPEYADAILTGQPRALAGSAGFGWDEGLRRAVLASTGGARDAALHALHTGQNAGSLSSGLHHASRERGAGFCTCNGLALAALAALDAGARRVVILDLDAHCGGGTHDILANERVSCADIAVSPFDAYEPSRPDWTLDLIEHAADYLQVASVRLASALRPAPDLLIYNAGMDPHEDNAVGGLAGVTTATLAARECLVFTAAAALRLPVAFVLAGGYASKALPRAALVDLHRLTIQAAT